MTVFRDTMFWLPAVFFVTAALVQAVESNRITRGGGPSKRNYRDDEDDSLTYEGYKVFEVYPKSQDDVDFLENLMLTETKMDFWSEPSRVEDKVTFMIPGELVARIRRRLRVAGLKYRETVQDVGQVLKPTMRHTKRASPSTVFDFNRFNTWQAISDYLNELVKKCPEDITCDLYSIGRSYEGREILVFKISKPGSNRKGLWIDATIHAREWITTATALKIINQLVRRPDTRSRRVVDAYDWYIVPVLNPDGYVYTFTKQRLWRKNRRPVANSSCVGVDLNRNFNFRWGTEGVSHKPCSEIYCGESGASEPEVQAVQKEALRIGSSLVGWVTLHSYGRMWLFPYGGYDNDTKTCQRTKDYDELEKVADVTVDAIEETYFTKWKLGTSCEVVYVNSGSSSDFIKDVAGVKYSYAMELRGDSFIINASQILPSFVEVWNGIVAMCDQIARDTRSTSTSILWTNRDNSALIASLILQILGSG